MKRGQWLALGLVCTLTGLGSVSGFAAQTAPGDGKPKVGVYDSRVLAYAQFWTAEHQQKLSALVKSAKEARDAGQTERFKELEAQIKAEQDRNHLQVFSTAPVDNVLAEIKDRVEAVKQEAGVALLVSKWDEAALKAHSRDQQVDVTDLLLRGFKLTEKQTKVVEDLRKQKPLPLEKAKELLRKGEL
jgi:hypothetical protein